MAKSNPSLHEPPALPPALVWPRLLELPSRNVKIVYLDLNHWISLAQASVGHPQGSPFVKILEACRAAKSSGATMFVLSSTHYGEMVKIKDPAQRQAVGDVMQELTNFTTLVGRVVVMELELDAILDQVANTPSGLPVIPLIGRGVRHSFGLRSGMRIMGPLGDETDRVRERIGAKVFDDAVAKMNQEMEQSALKGDTDPDEVGKLRALGWNPESANQVAEKRAAQEREQALRLDAESLRRRGRLRDIVSVREFLIEFQNILPRALAERNLVLSDVIPDRQSGRVFARAMPSTDVSIELKTAWHRNRDKKWTVNDIYDIDALALAVPYCDVVVTDKACHHALEVGRFGERMHTALLRDLCNLPVALDRCEPKRPHHTPIH